MNCDDIHVVVGIIYNKAKNKILISQRRMEKPHGGYWEFPGGKIETGENIKSAITRELYEELNINITEISPYLLISHDYGAYSVKLHVYKIVNWDGIEYGKEGQQLEWVRPDDLYKREFLAANYKIISALNLPSIYFITPDYFDCNKQCEIRFKNILQSGINLIQLRLERNRKHRLKNTAHIIKNMLDDYGGRLLVNAEPEQALELGADGVHINSKTLMQLKERPLSDEYLVAASCHNASEIEHANIINLDFVVLGPVKKTITHPDATILGWDKFSELAAKSSIPVYAIGGQQIKDIPTAKLNNGHGIAAINSIWNYQIGKEQIAYLSSGLF